MRDFIRVVAIALCAVITLSLSYTVGALLGEAVGLRTIGKALGILIAIIALCGWWIQREPWRIERYYSRKESILRGDLIIRTGYFSPGILVYGGFMFIIGCALIGMVLLWLLS